MIARNDCLFPQNNVISAAVGPQSCMPFTARGCESRGTCIASEVLKGAQRG
jgi:hypothetical protein